MTQFLRRSGFAAVLALITALGLAGCGSSSGGSGGGSTASGSSGGGSAEAQQALQAAYKGVTAPPPTTPTKPKPGVSVWIISCGQQIPSCATPVAGMQQAAEAAGWTSKVCDGQLNPDGWGSCMRQAVSAKAQVVIPVGIDCASIQQPFAEAKAAGVQIVGGGGSDCTETGGQSLMATERIELPDYPTVKDFFGLEGKLAADWIIGKTNGKGQVLETVFTDPVWGPWLSQGFEKEIATCSGCKIVNMLELANNDFVSGTAAQKFSTALLQSANADSVFIAVGGWMSSGFSQAINSSGRKAQLHVISGFGDKTNMDLIRNDNGQDAVVGLATQWGSWGSIDEAIRVLNGEKPVAEGSGSTQVIDKDHNLPSAGQDYDGNVDYKSAYKKLWGVS